ncbi:MAG: (4Fe-4S)-binding protein [Clostridiales Family XIII bacterium]|jgi:Fe-S-cluster-containing dehydrogenase component|nr:(4Fe-4S)-binding protein [Clostridiales Family XIII bacterium]
MKRWHMVFDVDKCIGCYTCMLACKDEHVGNEWLPYTDRQQKRDQKWLVMEKRERGTVPRVDLAYRPALCNHCAEAPCAKNAPGCVVKREDGIVLLDPRKAKGNRALVDACPFGAISWNEDVGAAQKCTFCAHLLDGGWKEPRCVQACPLRALRMVYMEDAEFEKQISGKGYEAIVPEAAGPRVWYKHLHRFTKNMISGEIIYMEDEDTEVVAPNVDVFLKQNGAVVARTVTSTFGEFWFDPVEPDSGDYVVEAEIPGRGSVSYALTMGADTVDVGILCPGKEAVPSHFAWDPITDPLTE